jgi:hypothetical protein
MSMSDADVMARMPPPRPASYGGRIKPDFSHLHVELVGVIFDTEPGVFEIGPNGGKQSSANAIKPKATSQARRKRPGVPGMRCSGPISISRPPI